MNTGSERWKEITRSEFPWEQEALAFVREALPDREPYRVWSNFEFIADDGSINEVDLLVLSPKGLFLIEIKSRPGMVKGDAGTWTWHHEGPPISLDNPLLLANRKAKRLASLLRRQKACQKIRVPFIEPLVFLSAPHINCQLDDNARQRIHVRDLPASNDRPARAGIIAALTHITPPDPADPRWRPLVDTPVARALSRAMEEVGIRPSQRLRRVGDFLLEHLLFEGPNYQDWQARHATLQRVSRRVRIYAVARAASATARETIARAAQREYQVLEGLQHPGILRALGYHEHDLGPALVFEHDPKALRLDHFLVEHARRLDVDLRLRFVRQIAEALQYAHKKRLVHRALSPQSVLVLEPEGPAPRVQIFNWQTAAREFGSTPSRGLTVTQHLGDLVETAAMVYMAPEALTGPAGHGEHLDVFGLGAIAYHLFAGQPPAASLVELVEKLREGKGLQIASVLNGAGKELSFLIQYSTHPEVSNRLDSVTDFLEFLERVEEEVTSPVAERSPVDPIEANAGDTLARGLVVRKRLGKGSTAVVFLVEKDGREQVLKLALDPEQNQRLVDEGEVLRKLRHQSIVELYEEVVRIGERVGLLMARAGDETLAQRLRAEGRLHVDLLQRFGENLIEAVDWLEQKGIPHRDIKPDNLGIVPLGRGDRLQLVLFDFSLSRTPPERIRAGTVPYLDPFLSLRRPPRWDLAAERFAAAVTLYEMATGTLPRWGDGKSDPAAIEGEATLDTELFEATLREPLTAFFARALRRDFQARYDNAEEMQRAWRQVFEHVDQPTITTDHVGADALDVAIESATLATPLVALGLSTRAINALERVNALDVHALLRLPLTQVSHMRGVGNKTRRELLDTMRKLVARFPAVEPAASDGAASAEPAVSTVDLIAQQLVPTRSPGDRTSETRLLRPVLGLEPLATPEPTGWPSQTAVAEALGLTRARVGQVLAKARERWARNRSLTLLRDDIAGLLGREGGVMTVAEARLAVLALRGSARSEPLRSQLAGAVIRAASEVERARAEPRWIVRRTGSVVLLALDEALADYAESLGRAADNLAVTDLLPSPTRVFEALQRVRSQSERPPVAPTRLVRLAAAASTAAAVSSRLEIYPRGMPAERALKLAYGALLGARELGEEQIRNRVAARYPEAAALPGRPALDDLLAATGSHLSWVSEANGGHGAYCARGTEAVALSSGSTPLPRELTGEVPRLDASPEVALARQVEERLQRAARDGAFLVLTVDTRHLERAERELVNRFPIVARSLDAELIRSMHEESQRVGADWDVVLRADTASPGSTDWRNLLTLVGRALGALEQSLADGGRTILLTHAGLLTRYGQVGFLERLRDRMNSRPEPGAPALTGVWVLIPSDDDSALPAIDGHAVPVVGPGQWARIPIAWIENAHRAGPTPPPALAPSAEAAR
jgi:serine/threonine protein kinase